MEHLYHPTHTHKAQRPSRKGKEKGCKSQSQGEVYSSSILDMAEALQSWAQSSYGCLHKTCKNQDKWHSNLKQRRAHEPPPLTEELLTVDAFCGRECHFSLRVWSLDGWSHSCNGPTPMSIYGQHPLNWVIKNKTKQDMKYGKGRRWEWIWEQWRVHLSKIYKKFKGIKIY